jgi:hypothetical protein
MPDLTPEAVRAIVDQRIAEHMRRLHERLEHHRLEIKPGHPNHIPYVIAMLAITETFLAPARPPENAPCQTPPSTNSADASSPSASSSSSPTGSSATTTDPLPGEPENVYAPMGMGKEKEFYNKFKGFKEASELWRTYTRQQLAALAAENARLKGEPTDEEVKRAIDAFNSTKSWIKPAMRAALRAARGLG